jgi:hypothetical protein
MATLTVIDEQRSRLGTLVAAKLPSKEVVLTDRFDTTLQTARVIVWLAPVERADDRVFELIDQIDARATAPEKIVMVTLAGINGEVPDEQLTRWYGDAAQELMLAHQYATKMIDELEIDYTLIRRVPLVDEETPVQVTNEGQPVMGTRIGMQALSEIIVQACDPTVFRNQSIGVSDQ